VNDRKKQGQGLQSVITVIDPCSKETVAQKLIFVS